MDNTTFKAGSKVKVVGGNHNLAIGTTLTLKGLWPGNKDYYEVIEYPSNTSNAKCFSFQDLIVVVVDTIETITERLEQIEKERTELNHKLHWLQETGNTQYDESEVKIYQILEKIRASSLDNKLEKLTIVKEIAKLLQK